MRIVREGDGNWKRWEWELGDKGMRAGREGSAKLKKMVGAGREMDGNWEKRVGNWERKRLKYTLSCLTVIIHSTFISHLLV